MLSLETFLNKNYDDENATQLDKLIFLVKKYVFSRNIHAVQEDEISGYFNKKLRFQIHNKFTKPLLSIIGLFAFKHKIADVTKMMQNIVLSDNPNRIIDIACGDNDFVIKLAKREKLELVVANDLSWFQLQSLQNDIDDESFKNSNSTLLFTNHDAKSLPFKDNFFDVVICKNVLHHMKTVEDLNAIISEMNRISNKIIIVEVLNPLYEGRWGRFRHKWIYDKLLKEVEAGDNFLSREAFNSVRSMGNYKESFEMPTVRGVYQFCIFENKNKIMKKEVEIKFSIGSSAQEIIKKIIANGWQSVGQINQTDTYYTSKYRDFIKPEECLRIREENNKIELTWKPPTNSLMTIEKQYWKEELNIQIFDNKTKIQRLLEVLDFIEYTIVCKERTTFKVDNETVVCVDNIKDIGYFIEIETFSDDELNSKSKNIKIAGLLDLDDSKIVNIPYRDIVYLQEKKDNK